jgi:signal transduction histidine kinase
LLKNIVSSLRQRLTWIYDNWVDPKDPSLSVEERNRVILFNSLLVLFAPFAPFMTLSVTDFSGTEPNDLRSLFITIAGTLGLMLCYPIHRSGRRHPGRYLLARWIAMGVAILLIMTQTELSQPPYPDVLYLLALPTAGVMLFSRRDMLILSSITTGLILWALLLKPDATYDTRNDFVTLSILLALLIVITSYYRDMLERQRSRLMVEQETALRVERERMHILHEFIQTASHDLRTPLTIINTSAALLVRATDPERREHHLTKLTNSVGTMESILDRIFYVIRLDTVTDDIMLPVSIPDLLHNLAVNLAMEATQRNVNVYSDIDERIPEIQGYGDDLGIALEELTRNALSNTPAGGKITLKATLDTAAVLIQIIDTGCGIPQESLPRVFDLFYRVEAHRPLEERQIGLGLPIAKKVVELHGGSISLDSTVDVGTTVTLKLPIMNKK